MNTDMDENFSTAYGHFNRDGSEYIITRPDTPKPWVNVISNGEYGLIVSQAGGGFSWLSHSNFNRLTRWQQDLIQDQWGKFIYFRDRQNGAIWSAAYQPVKHPQAKYRCRHGIGYSVLTCLFEDVVSEWTLFAAASEPLEIWILRIANNGKTKRSLSLFTYLEWCLGFAPDNHREFHKAFLETEFAESEQVFLARKRLWEVADEKGRHWNRRWPFTAFHACSEKIAGFEGDKELFLGMYGDLHSPALLQRGHCRNSSGKWGDGIACLQTELDLLPGDSREVVFLLGAAGSDDAALRLSNQFRTPAVALQELAKVKETWRKRLEPLMVHTPDVAFDLLMNTWLKYQAISCRLFGRAAYYQQSGAIGFRDQLQDSLLMLPLDADFTRRQILLHAKHQFRDGSVYHWWHPLTETGLHSKVSDNLLWLPFVTYEYLKETGDLTVLEQQVTFVDQGEATLWEHCRLALQRALQWRSPRGLPLIGDHDWNDGLNAVGNDMKGESIWLAHFLYKNLRDFAVVAEKLGKKSQAEEWLEEAQSLKEAIDRYGWDGQWFWRASKDDGSLVGSGGCEEGKIYLNAQTWAVISQSATEDRALQAMASAAKYLYREFGPLLLWPAYSVVDENIGYLTRYAPGRRENGGLYTHAATWAIWAETILGHGEKAFELFKRLAPIYRGMNPELYQVEPYVTPGNVEGPDSPYFGRGGWTWYTGSAAWLFKVCTDAILGIQADWDGLRIHPCIPPTWKEFSLSRTFRQAEYRIRIENPEAVETGLVGLEIDGQFIGLPHAPREYLLKPFPAGSKHDIRVIMGKAKKSL